MKTNEHQNTFKVGGYYNWKGQHQRLIYLGYNYSSNGYWHQFALIEYPNKVWCECLDSDLQNIEESVDIEEVFNEHHRLSKGLNKRWSVPEVFDSWQRLNNNARNRRKRARKAARKR